MQRLIAAALAALVFTACSVIPSGGTLAGEWRLVSGTLLEAPITPVADAPITLTLAAAEASGSAGCNSYGGPVSITNDRVSFGDLMTTLIGCQPPQAEAESAYLEALGLVERGRRDGDRLTLSGPQVELVFELVPPTTDATLSGTSWRLETVIQGDAAMSFEGIEGIGAAFADGSVTVTVGCRVLAGSFTAAGGGVAVDRMQVGASSCPDATPSAVEEAIVDGLARGFTAAITEDRLQLTTASGMGLEFRAATR
jgi:heat shock protein HslJ